MSRKILELYDTGKTVKQVRCTRVDETLGHVKGDLFKVISFDRDPFFFGGMLTILGKDGQPHRVHGECYEPADETAQPPSHYVKKGEVVRCVRNSEFRDEYGTIGRLYVVIADQSRDEEIKIDVDGKDQTVYADRFHRYIPTPVPNDEVAVLKKRIDNQSDWIKWGQSRIRYLEGQLKKVKDIVNG